MPPRRRQQQQEGAGGGQPQGGVYGPTSALTSFLREQGITAPPRRRRSDQQTPPTGANAAGPSGSATPAGGTPDGDDSDSANVTLTLADDSVDAAIEQAAAGGAQSPAAVASGSDTGGGAKKRKSTAGDSAAAKKKKAKQAQANSDAFNLDFAPKAGRYDDRTPGNTAKCGECGKKFTISKYTVANHRGSGLLCGPCQMELTTTDPLGGKPAGGSAKKTQKKRKPQKAPEEREIKPVKTLQQICIAIIGDNIVRDNVEALGDIGERNFDRIARAVCKHRALSDANLNLFLDVNHRELTLYDCTNIKEASLKSIASFCPHLRKIVLKMCGRLNDAVLDDWATRMRSLTHLELYAPYLVTRDQWIKYLTSFKDTDSEDEQSRSLTGFGLQQSARFDDDCIRALVDNHKDTLEFLQLSEIGKLSTESLKLLHPLQNLTHLDLRRAGFPAGDKLKDEDVVALIENCGEHLRELILDQNASLTDRVLTEGVKVHCPRLKLLSLGELDKVQSSGIQGLFTGWVNQGLTALNLHRVLPLENDAMLAILAHSGSTLEVLDVHSCDELCDEGLATLARSAPRLRSLDVSFVRAIDDFFIRDALDNMPELETLFVHGDNRVSDACPQRRGVRIRGQENSASFDT